jgi:MFS family permease
LINDHSLHFQAASEKHRSKALSVMETLFGLGLMAGPFIGGILYELGGFYLPFVVCGGAMVVCSITALALFKTKLKSKVGNPSSSSSSASPEAKEPSAKYLQLLRVPGVFYSCFVLGLSGISISWYLPTLQVRIVKKPFKFMNVCFLVYLTL